VSPVDPNQHDRFFLSQRFRPMVNQYEVSTLGADEKSAGETVCFKAQQVWDPRARYDVTDPDEKQFGTSATSPSRSPTTSTTSCGMRGSAGSSESWGFATATA
jgi:hypothetical protein